MGGGVELGVVGWGGVRGGKGGGDQNLVRDRRLLTESDRSLQIGNGRWEVAELGLGGAVEVEPFDGPPFERERRGRIRRRLMPPLLFEVAQRAVRVVGGLRRLQADRLCVGVDGGV